MTPEEAERLARLEVQYAHLAADLSEVRTDVKALVTVATKARGGWLVLVAAVSVASAAATALNWLVGLLARGGH